MMHIAFITPEYPHAKANHSAGIGSSVRNLAVALVNEGLAVTVFVYGQKNSEVLHENGVRVHLIADKKYTFGKWFFYRKHLQRYIKQVVASDQINLIEAADWTGITAFMKFSVPLVIRFHGSDTYFCHLENRKQKRKNFWFEKSAIKKAQAYAAPTKFAGALSAELFGLDQEKVVTLHNGIELDAFTNSVTHPQKNKLLYLGTLIRKKGVLELPGIVNELRKQHPDAQLVLIGADSKDSMTGAASTWQLMQQEITQEDRNNISYLGKVPYSEVRRHIEQAHVCVFPTLAETLGMVTIESMAMEKPVVSSNMGWVRELIEDGVSGFLVDPTNHKEFASKIGQLLSDEKFSLEMGRMARTRAEKLFDIRKIAKHNIEFYQSVLANK